MNLTEAIELFEYNDWSNARIFESLEVLSANQWVQDVGGSFHTIQATATHLVGAEWIWLERWRGASPTELPAWAEGLSLEALREELTRVEEGRRSFLASLEENELSADLPYTFVSGARRQTQLGLLFRHLVNHSSYHRGQLAVFLRRLGRTPPSTDLVVWDYQRRGL